MDWIENLLELILIVRNLIFFLEIGKIYNNINESIKKLTKELTKKTLIDNLSGRILQLEFEKITL